MKDNQIMYLDHGQPKSSHRILHTMISIDDIPEVLRAFPQHLSVIQSPYKDNQTYHCAVGGDGYTPRKQPSHLKFNINRASYKLGRGLERSTLLMYGIVKDDMKFINALLSLPNILINKRSGRGFTALHLAVMKSKTEIVHRLLRVQGIDVNLGDNVRHSSEATSHSCSGFPLLTAVFRKNLPIVLALLRMPGIHVNQRNEAGETAFSAALQSTNKDILILLRSCDGIIRKGKFVDAHGSFTVIYYDDDELYSNNDNTYEFVLKTRYEMNHTRVLGRISNYDVVNGEELLKAVAFNDIPQISTLLQNPKVDINYAAGEPFQDCTDEERRELSEPIRNFLAQWSRPYISVTGPGDNALWRAIIGENAEVVRMLLEHPQIDVNFVHGTTGKSMLTHVIETRHSENITMLLNRPEIDLFPLEFEHDRHYFTDNECCIPKTHYYPCGTCFSCDSLDNENIQELISNAYKRQGLFEKREGLLEAYKKRQEVRNRRWLSPEFIPAFLETATQREKLMAVRRLLRLHDRFHRHRNPEEPESEDITTVWCIVPTIHKIWLCSRDRNGDSLVHKLSKLPTHPTFLSMISDGRIPIHALNGVGKSPLIIAAENDRERTVQLLLSMPDILVPRDYEFPTNRSGFLIRKHLAVQNEIKMLKYMELFSAGSRLNHDVLTCIVPFLMPVC